MPLAPLVVRAPRSVVAWWCRRVDAGQTTAEYALVLLAAAAVALLALAWATRSGKVGQLLNAVVDSIISKVT
jgi:hypothetical protein